MASSLSKPVNLSCVSSLHLPLVQRLLSLRSPFTDFFAIQAPHCQRVCCPQDTPSDCIIHMKPWMSQHVSRANSLARFIDENLGQQIKQQVHLVRRNLG